MASNCDALSLINGDSTIPKDVIEFLEKQNLNSAEQLRFTSFVVACSKGNLYHFTLDDGKWSLYHSFMFPDDSAPPATIPDVCKDVDVPCGIIMNGVISILSVTIYANVMGITISQKFAEPTIEGYTSAKHQIYRYSPDGVNCKSTYIIAVDGNDDTTEKVVTTCGKFGIEVPASTPATPTPAETASAFNSQHSADSGIGEEQVRSPTPKKIIYVPIEKRTKKSRTRCISESSHGKSPLSPKTITSPQPVTHVAVAADKPIAAAAAVEPVVAAVEPVAEPVAVEPVVAIAAAAIAPKDSEIIIAELNPDAIALGFVACPDIKGCCDKGDDSPPGTIPIFVTQANAGRYYETRSCGGGKRCMAKFVADTNGNIVAVGCRHPHIGRVYDVLQTKITVANTLQENARADIIGKSVNLS